MLDTPDDPLHGAPTAAAAIERFGLLEGLTEREALDAMRGLGSVERTVRQAAPGIRLDVFRIMLVEPRKWTFLRKPDLVDILREIALEYDCVELEVQEEIARAFTEPAKHDAEYGPLPRVHAGNGLGTIEAPDRVEGRVILDGHDPISTARTIAAAKFTSNDRPTLHHHRGAFWQWRGSFYSLIEDGDIKAEIWTFLEHADRLDGSGSSVAFKPTRARVSDVLDAMAAACNLDARIEPPAWLGNEGTDQSPPGEFLSVANGLLHLSTGELYPHNASYFGLSASDVEFDPAAPLPLKWLGFLSELFGEDVEALAALQDWFGYALAPDTSQHKILLVVGPSRSGKGTIARVLSALVGRNSVAGPTLASLSSNFGLEPLIGKPLAIISDARLGARSDQAAIAERLLSISGEDALTIDRKFRRAWHGRLTTRFMLLTNELPRLVDASGALAKRFLILTLENSFYGREDPTLTGQLLAELPGIS